MAGTLTVILDRSELGSDHAAAVASAAELPADGPVLAFDPDAWVSLRAAGVRQDILVASSFITDATRVEAVADRLLEFWRRHAEGSRRGWPLAELVGYRHVRWTRRLAMVAVPLINAIDAVRPARLRLLTLPGGHALDGDPEDRRTPVLAGLAADIAAARKVAVRLEPRPLPGRGAMRPPAGEPAPDHDAERAAPPSVDGCVLIISDGPEGARDRVLAETIEEASGCRVLRVVPGSAVGHGLVGDLAYAGLRPPIAMPEADAATRRLQLAAAGLEPGDPARLLAGPGIRPHLAFLAGPYAAAIAGNLERWASAIQRHRPAAVVASYPGVPLEVAARIGVPAILLPHGPMMIGEDRYHRCLPEAVAIGAVGPRHHASLLADGIAAERVRITGVPRTAGPTSRTVDRRPGDGFHILLPTGEAARPTQVGALPVVDFVREHAAIAAIATAAAQRGWTLHVRPHPRYDRDAAFYASAVGDTPGVTVVPASARPLGDALAMADVVLFTGAPSSALAEAAAAGRPVLRLTSAELADHAGRWGLEAIAREPDAAGLLGRLDALAADPAAWADAAAEATHHGRQLLAPAGEHAAAAFVLERMEAGRGTRPEPGADRGCLRPMELSPNA